MKNIYLILGEEKLDAQEKIKSLQHDFSISRSETRFGFDDEDIERTEQEIETPSLFAENFFTIIDNAEEIKERSASKLARTIEQSDNEGVLIFRSNANRISSYIEKIIPASNKFRFYLMFENLKPRFVATAFKNLGYAIDQDAIEELLNLVDNDKESILRSCRKVVDSLAQKGGKRILLEDVSDILDYDKDNDMLVVFSHIANRRKKAAIESVQSVARTYKSLTPVIASQINYLRRAQSFMLNKKIKKNTAENINTINGSLSIRYPAEKAFMAQYASNYSYEESLRNEYILLKSQKISRSGNDFELQLIQFSRELLKVMQ